MRSVTLLVAACMVACHAGEPPAIPPIGSVVHLLQGGARWSSEVGGTAFAIGDGRLVTAGHAIKIGGGLEVETWDGQRGWADVVWSRTGRSSPCLPQPPFGGRGCDERDPASWDRDVALLHLRDHLPLEGLQFGPAPRIGQPVIVAGWPASRRAVTSGIVADVEGNLFSLDAYASAGSSGSPVTDYSGRLIGMVIRREKRGRLGLAVSAGQIARELQYDETGCR